MVSGGSNTRALLDLLDALLHLPPQERARRVADTGLSDDDRAKIESWLKLEAGGDSFLETPPSLVLDGIKLLNGQAGESLSEPPANPGAISIDSLHDVHLSTSLPPHIPGYEVLEPLGRGATATVWRALQRGTGQTVALKVIDPLLLHSPRARSRFERELRLMGKLRHPFISRLYDGGASAGVCYCAMEFVDGLPLDQFVQAEGLNRDRVVELMISVCQAVAHAHQNGIIHRDLKPSNILVTPDGHPHVLDFGLATAFEPISGEVIASFETAGTLGYMAPEQASGHRDQIDTRSDVYSLGVILHRLLTGAMPHDSETAPFEIANATLQQDLTRPTRLDPTLAPDLVAILQKSLSREREQRYGSAGEFSADLNCYLRGDLVSARPPTLSYFVQKRMRRYRSRLIAAGFIATALAAFMLLGVIRIRQERNVAIAQRLAAQQQRSAAEAMRSLAETRLADSLIAQGNALAQNQRWVEAKERYREADTALRTQGRDTFEVTVQLSLALGEAPPPLQIYEGHSGAVTATAIAVGNRVAASGSEDQTVKLWDVATARCTRTLSGATAAITCLAFTPDGSLLLSGDANGNVFAWDVASGSGVYTRHNRFGIVSLCCSRDGNRMMTVCSDSTAAIWDVGSGNKVCDLEVRPGEQVYGSGAFSSDGLRCLCACSADHGLAWWDAQSGRRRSTLGSTPEGVTSVSISPDGKWAAVGQGVARSAANVLLFDLATGKRLRLLAGHGSGSTHVAFTSDSKYVLALGIDGTVTRWNVESGECDANVWGDRGGLGNASFSTDGNLVLSGAWSGSADHTMKLWMFPGPRGGRQTWLPRSTAAACTPDARLLLATSQDDAEIWVRDLATGIELSKLPVGGNSPKCSVAVSPNGRWVLSGAADGSVWLWDLQIGACLGEIGNQDNEVWSLAFSSDSRFALSHSGSQLAYWDVSQRRLVRMIRSDWVLGRAIQFSADGTMAIGVNTHANIMRWRLSTGELVPLAQYQQQPIYPCEGGASLDLASGRGVVGHNSDVLVWDQFVAGPQRVLKKYTGAVQATAIWPGGKFAAAGDNDSTIRIWDIQGVREVCAIGGTYWPIKCVTLSPDGRQLFAAGQDGVQRWRLSLADDYRAFQPRLVSARSSRGTSSENSASLKTLGEWYFFRNADLLALECFNRAGAGGMFISHLALARCYWRTNRIDEAQREFRAARLEHEAPDYYIDLCIRAAAHSDKP